MCLWLSLLEHYEFRRFADGVQALRSERLLD
jgi:hypothetical protein